VRSGWLLGCLVLLGITLGCSAQPFSTDWYEPIEVYLIPHSHCDVGWKKTVDGYYTEQVRDILNGVTQCLEEKNPNPDPRLVRKFNWDVQAFFQLYWNEISPEWQDVIRAQVADGRMGFAGFGWVQSDEAATEAYGRIMQLTEGHLAVARLFPEVLDQPRVCWQIDPFGASSLSPTLFAKAGFDAVVNTRIPRVQQDAFRANKSLEFIWKGNPLGESYPMLWHNMGDGVHPYATPGDPPEAWGGREGFRWEDSLRSNPIVTEENVAARAAVFANDLQVRASWFQPGAPVLIPFGADFLFQDAHIEFDNMDKVLEEINAQYDTFKVSVRYATVQEWVTAMMEADLQFPTYEAADFFPYNKATGNIWGGFYTTRPLLKRKIRQGEALVRAAETLHALAGVYLLPEEAASVSEPVFQQYFKAGYLLDQCRQEVAIGHHHDAITGTSYHEVVSDYFDRLDEGASRAREAIGISASLLLCDTATDEGIGSSACPILEGYQLHGNQSQIIDTASFGEGEMVTLVLSNSLGVVREEMVTVRCSSLATIVDAVGDELAVSASPVTDERGDHYLISFIADLPALGLGTFYVQRQASDVMGDCFSQEAAGTEDHMSIGNDWIQVNIDAATGGIASITNWIGPLHGEELPVNQEFFLYFSPNSDAYQFTPSSVEPLSSGPDDVTIVINTCELYQEAVVQIGDLVTVTYRVPQLVGRTRLFGMQGLGVEMTIDVGEMENSRELVQRFRTGWSADNVWYTDNGLALDQHKLIVTGSGPLKDASQNYKPVRSTAMIVDSHLHLDELRTVNEAAGLLLLTGQPAGTTSLEDGTLEVMIHRKTGTYIWQDYRGASSHYRLFAGPVPWLDVARAHQNLQVQFPVDVLHVPGPSTAMPYGSFFAPFGAESLPLDVHLFTFAAEDFFAVAIPELDYDDFLDAVASGRSFPVTPDTVDADKVAVRLHNLYADGISEVSLPFSGCEVDWCEERGITLLPHKEHHRFAQDPHWRNQPLSTNAEYAITGLEDLDVFQSSCERLHLSPSDIRTLVYKFDCV